MNTPTEPDHFDYESIEYALKMNILPQPCCPKTYFVPNDNEMDEEFEEDCPACKKAGYLERDYLEKLDEQIEEQKLLNLSKSLEKLSVSNESNNLPIGEMISNVFSSFMSSMFEPIINKEETAIKKDNIKKIKKTKYLDKKRKQFAYPFKVKKIGIKKFRSNKKKNRKSNISID
jgi:hypothetical protein